MKFAKFIGIGAAGLVAGLASVSVAMSEGKAPAAPAEAAIAEGAYRIDGGHSSVVFRVKHNNVAYFYGRFNKVEGSFAINPDDPSKNSADVTITADSVDTQISKRDDHLKSQDFFSASEFPTITFKSKSWKPTGKVDGEQAYDVTGDLTLRGKTKEIVVQIRHTGSATGQRGEVAGIETKFTINRSDFGMDYMVGKGLGDEVTIMVGLEGNRR